MRSETTSNDGGWICERLGPDTVAHIQNSALRVLYLYWDRLRGERAMPLKSELNPASIPGVLPHVGLMEIIDGGRAFKIRLLGTRLRRELADDPTGRVFDAHTEDPVARRVLSVLQLVVRDRAPYRTFIRSTGIPGKDIYSGESLNLPLTCGGDAVAFVLGAQVLTPRESSI